MDESVTRYTILGDLCKEYGFEDLYDEMWLYKRFFDLIKEFQSLREITNTDKSSSYEFNFCSSVFIGMSIELGTYEISDWKRHTASPSFETLGELVNWLDETVGAAKIQVMRTQPDDE